MPLVRLTMEADDSGLAASVFAVFLRLAMDGWKVGAPGIAGAAPGGGFGADMVGGLGADTDLAEDSGSDK